MKNITKANARRRCSARNSSGGSCGMAPLKGSRFCYIHAPETAGRRVVSRRRAGQRQRIPNAKRVTTPATIGDVALELTQALADARIHPNSLQRGMLIARLTLAVLKVIEVGQLEVRLDSIEERLEAMERVQRWRPE